MMRGGKCIIVTGTPGVGKTRFSKILGRRLGIPVIGLNRLIEEGGCLLGRDRPRRSGIVDMRRAARLVRSILDERPGEKLIIESHLSHLLVDPIDVIVAFVLRCHPDVLKKRLKRRGYFELKIAENVLSEILDGCLTEAVDRLGRERVYELDTTSIDVYELADEAVKAIQGKVRWAAGRVDWIKKLESEGKLLKYLY